MSKSELVVAKGSEQKVQYFHLVMEECHQSNPAFLTRLGFHERLPGLPRESVMGKKYVFLKFCCRMLPLLVIGIFMWCDSAASCHFAIVYIVKYGFCRLL